MPPKRQILALFLCLAPFLGAQGEVWMDNAFRFRVAISNLSPVGGVTLTDFPVLIRLTNQTFLQQVKLTDGGDVCFSGVDGVQLFHEIEDFDKATGSITAWVCLPSFSNSTKIFLYYANGDASFAVRASNSTSLLVTNVSSFRTPLLSTNVWDPAFRLVLHFGETSGSPVDSSRYGLTPSRVGTGNITGSNGLVGRVMSVVIPSQDFSTAKVPLKYAYGGFLPVPTQCSVSMWINCRSPSNFVTAGNYMGLLSYFANGSGNGIAMMRWNHLEQPGMNLFALSASPANWGNRFDQWNYLSMAGSVVNMAAVTNGTNFSITNGVVAKTNTSLTTMNVAYSTNTDLTIGGSDPGLANTPGIYDEFRISHSNRGSGWLLTEYSNVVLADTNLFYALGPPQPGPLLSRLSNEVTSPLPYPGSLFRLYLDPDSLSIPYRGSNYISNIEWMSSNYMGLGFNSNTYYGADTNAYFWSIPFSSGGNYSNHAILRDALGGVWTNTPLFLRVYSNANFDLSALNVKQTNEGFVFDLFGVNNSVAAPSTVNVFRDGAAVGLKNLGGNRYLDSGNLFYGNAYNYSVRVSYPESAFTNNTQITGNQPSGVSQMIGGAGSDFLSDFEIKVFFSNQSFAAPNQWTLRRSSDRKENPWQVPRQRAYGEFELVPSSPAIQNFGKPIPLVYQLQIAAGILKLPGWTSEGLAPLFTEDYLRISLAQWDGLAWRELPSRLVSQNNLVSIEASAYASGRYGLLLKSSAKEKSGNGPFLNSRVLVPSSSESARNQLLLYFFPSPGETAWFRVISDKGKLVYENRNVAGSQVAWDLKQDGQFIAPGIYIYSLKIGNTSSRESRGTFVVGFP